MASKLRIVYYIIAKDLQVYYFKPPNLIMGLMFPVVLVFSMALRSRSDMGSLAPGLLAMTLLFGTSSIEVVLILWERNRGTFERLLLAPISLTWLASAKILGGAVFGLFISMGIFLFSLPFLKQPIVNPPLLILTVIVSMWCFSTFGMLFGTLGRDRGENSMVLTNYVRFPMIFLSGIFVPVVTLPGLLQPVAYLLPLTYTVSLLREAFLGEASLVNPALALVALAGFGGIFHLFAVRSLVADQG